MIASLKLVGSESGLMGPRKDLKHGGEGQSEERNRQNGPQSRGFTDSKMTGSGGGKGR